MSLADEVFLPYVNVYTMGKKMKFYIGLNTLQLANITNIDIHLFKVKFGGSAHYSATVQTISTIRHSAW